MFFMNSQEKNNVRVSHGLALVTGYVADKTRVIVHSGVQKTMIKEEF